MRRTSAASAAPGAPDGRRRILAGYFAVRWRTARDRPGAKRTLRSRIGRRSAAATNWSQRHIPPRAIAPARPLVPECGQPGLSTCHGHGTNPCRPDVRVLANSATWGVEVSTAPFNRAMRPTFDRFRSCATATVSSGDLRHQATSNLSTGARACFRLGSTMTLMSDRPLTCSTAGSTTLRIRLSTRSYCPGGTPNRSRNRSALTVSIHFSNPDLSCTSSYRAIAYLLVIAQTISALILPHRPDNWITGRILRGRPNRNVCRAPPSWTGISKKSNR